MKKLKIALVGPAPARACLRADQIRPSRRSRQSHPSTWIETLCRGFSQMASVECCLFVHSRDVSSIQSGSLGGIACRFVPKFEPGHLDPILGALTACVQMRPLIRHFDPDVVLGFGTESMYGLLASSFGIPSAVFIQGIVEKLPLDSYRIPAWKQSFMKRIERRAILRVNAVIAENKFAADWALSINPLLKTAIIPHPVVPDFFDVVSAYEPRFIFIGSVNSNKGPDRIARAFAAIAPKYPGAEFVVIGPPGNAVVDLNELINQRGLSGQIKMVGTLDRAELKEQMSRACCLVLASKMDTSPNVITEAHAAGLPVIATRVGGIPEMIEEGKDGFLVDVDDESALTDRMERFLISRELAAQMGASGRKSVAEHNAYDGVVEKYVSFLTEVAAMG